MLIFSVVATTLSLVSASETLKACAWQSASAYPDANDFPENSRPEIISRPSTAIAFTGTSDQPTKTQGTLTVHDTVYIYYITGGGSRSYLASVGYLAGLHTLGLIPNIR